MGHGLCCPMRFVPVSTPGEHHFGVVIHTGCERAGRTFNEELLRQTALGHIYEIVNFMQEHEELEVSAAQVFSAKKI